MKDPYEDMTFPPCRLCGGEVSLCARWRGIGSAPLERLYVWVQCAGTPPCETGDCHKEPAAAVAAWERQLKYPWGYKTVLRASGPDEVEEPK